MARARANPHGEERPKAASQTLAPSSTPSFETAAARPPQDEVRRIPHRASRENFRWDGVEMRPYKEDDRALYKAITRQILFSDPNMAGELR